MESLTKEFQPDKRLSKNGLRRAHWRETQPLVRQAREDAYILGLIEAEDGWVTPDRCRVQVTQFWFGSGRYDWDGLATLCAPAIDGLVDSGAMPDDDPGHVIDYTMTAERVKTRAESRVAVTVTAISE